MLDRVGGDAVAAAGWGPAVIGGLLPEPSSEAHSHDLITDMATVTMRYGYGYGYYAPAASRKRKRVHRYIERPPTEISLFR